MPPPCRLCFLVKRAPNGEAWFVENMRVNHRRGNVAVPKQLLNRTNILAIFQQVSRETVPERMATGRFGQARLVDRSLDRLLKILFRNVMPTRFARPRIDGKFCRWENILPRPRFVRVWILPFQSEWKMNFSRYHWRDLVDEAHAHG